MEPISKEKLQEVLSKNQEQEEYTIEKLVKYGVLEKEVDIPKGWKVLMHTLTQEEKEKSNEGIPDTAVTSVMKRQEALKRPTLAWAITRINKEVFETEEQKKQLFAKLNTFQGSVIDLWWIEYQKLFAEQFEMLLEGIKKKS